MLARWFNSHPRISCVRPQKNSNVLLLHCRQTCYKPLIFGKILQKLEDELVGVGEIDPCTDPHQIHDCLQLKSVTFLHNDPEHEIHKSVREVGQRLLTALT